MLEVSGNAIEGSSEVVVEGAISLWGRQSLRGS